MSVQKGDCNVNYCTKIQTVLISGTTDPLSFFFLSYAVVMFQIYCLHFGKPVSDSLLVEQIEIYSYEALFTSRKVS